MKRTRGLTRRDFMKTMAVLGAAASTSGLLQSCGSSSQQTESKTLFFNNSNLDPDDHDFFVAVGDKNYKLQRITPEKLRSAKESNSFLKAYQTIGLHTILRDYSLQQMTYNSAMSRRFQRMQIQMSFGRPHQCFLTSLGLQWKMPLWIGKNPQGYL